MPEPAPYLQIQDAIYRDGEELAAALQACDSLQGAAARADRGLARAPTLIPSTATLMCSQKTRGPAKCLGDSCLGQVFWWRWYLNWVAKRGEDSLHKVKDVSGEANLGPSQGAALLGNRALAGAAGGVGGKQCCHKKLFQANLWRVFQNHRSFERHSLMPSTAIGGAYVWLVCPGVQREQAYTPRRGAQRRGVREECSQETGGSVNAEGTAPLDHRVPSGGVGEAGRIKLPRSGKGLGGVPRQPCMLGAPRPPRPPSTPAAEKGQLMGLGADPGSRKEASGSPTPQWRWG